MGLKDYKGKAPKEFWEIFPKSDLPKEPSTGVNVRNLEKMLEEEKEHLLSQQLARGARVCKNLREGASACQKEPPLGSEHVKHAKSTFLYGEVITDNVATWVKEGFVAGPFDEPPTKKFRSNSILAVKQGEKVRPVLNVSLPENSSFNDNIDDKQMEKVTMSSARAFGYTLVEAGIDADFLKFDQKDAYKNIPAQVKDYRLQGFEWLGKFFVETRQIFGARTAVANYDTMGRVMLDLAIAKSGVLPKYVHRQLDDVPMASPSKVDDCDKFSEAYKEVCSRCNVKLAKNCENFDKAFGKTKYGKVLGIWFKTSTLEWRLPEEKIFLAEEAIRDIMKNASVNLNQMQKLLGRLNNIALMCPFLKCFTGPLLKTLGMLQVNPNAEIPLSEQCRQDLEVFCGFLADSETWNQIPPRPIAPPRATVEFISDAAGSQKKLDSDLVGFASVGFSIDGEIFYARQLFWEKGVLENSFDENGKNFGSKTMTLEFLGLLLPFLEIPEKIANQNVILKVDNIGCYHSFQSFHSNTDSVASVLIRTIHLIAAYIGSKIHVVHAPRVSTWEAEMADRMSRKSTTTARDKKLLGTFGKWDVPSALKHWLSNPCTDWKLPSELLSYVENKLK